MNNTNHTPLPWAYGNGAVWADCNGEGNSPKEVASYVEEADGEFIVRACNNHEELLAALDSMIEIASRYAPTGLDLGGPYNSDEITKARALVARATGKTTP